MPPYATLSDLQARASSRSLAQAAAPDDCDVDASLLGASIAGGARSTYTQAQRDAGDAAVARLQQALDDAIAEINGWIAPRYPGVADTPPAVLTAYCVDIALYRLYQPGDPEDPRLIRYKTAIAWCKEVARGLIDLSAPAPDPDDSAGVQVSAPPRVFGGSNLDRFTRLDVGSY